MNAIAEKHSETALALAADPEYRGSLAVSLARAEVDQQITTARAYPRSITRSVQNITTLATLDAESAEECIYALPRGGKPIKGPSVRLAEIISSQWGNCRVGARVVHVDRFEKFIEAEGVFHDLETNTATTARVRRRLSKRDGKLFDDDMIVVTGNAACAIAKRNAILGGVPKAVWRPAYSAVEQVLVGDVKTLTERRARAVTSFAAWGVTPAQVFAALGVAGEQDITIEHLPTLTAMRAALKNGEATVEEIFTGDAAPARKTAPLGAPKKEPPAIPHDEQSYSAPDKDGKGRGTPPAAEPESFQDELADLAKQREAAQAEADAKERAAAFAKMREEENARVAAAIEAQKQKGKEQDAEAAIQAKRRKEEERREAEEEAALVAVEASQRAIEEEERAAAQRTPPNPDEDHTGDGYVNPALKALIEEGTAHAENGRKAPDGLDRWYNGLCVKDLDLINPHMRDLIAAAKRADGRPL